MLNSATNLSKNERSALSGLIEGKPQTEIANDIGLSQTGISRIARKDNIREIVRAAQTQLINDNLDNVLYNQRRKIELAKEVLNGNGVVTTTDGIEIQSTILPGVDNKTILELADKAENRIGQGIGIFPTHTQSVQYIQLTAGRDMILSDDVLDIIGRHVTEAIEGKVEDIDAPTLQFADNEGI